MSVTTTRPLGSISAVQALPRALEQDLGEVAVVGVLRLVDAVDALYLVPRFAQRFERPDLERIGVDVERGHERRSPVRYRASARTCLSAAPT
jgi:hypothetical protein